MLEVPEPRATDRANDDYQLEGARKGSDPCKRFTTAVTRVSKHQLKSVVSFGLPGMSFFMVFCSRNYWLI